MSEDLPVEDILANAHAAELLAVHFDFDVRARAPQVWFGVVGAESLHAVAADGAGGQYVLCRLRDGATCLFYASSEGQAGVVANDMREGLALMVSMPGWRDVLKFSGRGRLDEMRLAWSRVQKESNVGQKSLPGVQAELRALFRLQTPVDPVALLHQRIAEGPGRFPMQTEEGDAFEPLFGPFFVRQHPVWRRAL
jgi:hypothetical protein